MVDIVDVQHADCCLPHIKNGSQGLNKIKTNLIQDTGTRLPRVECFRLVPNSGPGQSVQPRHGLLLPDYEGNRIRMVCCPQRASYQTESLHILQTENICSAPLQKQKHLSLVSLMEDLKQLNRTHSNGSLAVLFAVERPHCFVQKQLNNCTEM